MKMPVAITVLFAAAGLEAGGDALIRAGLFGASPLRRLSCLMAGALVLFLYGCVVNLPRWDFGRLLGIYLAAFFFMAQGINWVGFGQRPTLPICVGGGFIMLGGGILALWRP